MPTITYIIHFVHCDKTAIEEQHYTSVESAWEAFRFFVEPDSFDMRRSAKAGNAPMKSLNAGIAVTRRMAHICTPMIRFEINCKY